MALGREARDDVGQHVYAHHDLSIFQEKQGVRAQRQTVPAQDIDGEVEHRYNYGRERRQYRDG